MVFTANVRDSFDVAKIHLKSLDQDFLPLLGLNFLNVFYKCIFADSKIICFVIKKNIKVVGFVVGTENMSDFFQKIIKKNFFVFLPLVIKRIFQYPFIIRNIYETFLYPKKDLGPEAELVIIAIGKESRGKGLGYKLVKSLEKEFEKRGIKEYKLTVTKRNISANQFYNKLGFEKLTEFNLYNKDWNILVKKL